VVAKEVIQGGLPAVRLCSLEAARSHELVEVRDLQEYRRHFYFRDLILPAAGRTNANLERARVTGLAASGEGQRSTSLASSTQEEGAKFRHWSHLQHVGGGVVRRLRRCQRRGQLVGGQQLLRRRQRQRRRGARRLLPARVPPVRRALQIREDTKIGVTSMCVAIQPALGAV